MNVLHFCLDLFGFIFSLVAIYIAYRKRPPTPISYDEFNERLKNVERFVALTIHNRGVNRAVNRFVQKRT